MRTSEERSLPVYPAGSVPVDFTIRGLAETLERDTRWGAHAHPVDELLWNDVGPSTIRVGPRTWTVTPTIGLWMPAGTLHSGTARTGTTYRATYFALDPGRQRPADPASVRITPLLRALLDRHGQDGLAPASRELTEAMVLDVLSPAPHQFLVHEPTAALLRPIVDAVLAAPGDRRTLGEWAASLKVSERTITRAFRAETGLGFARWVATVRVQRAAALLAAGEHLEDIAEDMGYASPSAFGAAFRKLTGSSPGSLRS